MARRFLWLILFSVLAWPASAAPSKKEVSTEILRVEKSMEEGKAKAAAVEARRADAARELSGLQEKLVTATEALAEKQDEKERIEDRAATLEAEAESKEAERAEAEKNLRERAAFLTRVSRFPPLAYLGDPAKGQAAFHQALLVRALVPEAVENTKRLALSARRIDEARARLLDEKRLLKSAQQNLTWQRNNLDQLIKTRRGLMQKTEAEKAHIAEQLNALTEEAKDLRELLEKITRASTFARNKPLGKGALRLPVAGRILRGFGANDAYGVASPGLTIAGAPEAVIAAPAAGRIVFAGPFRGYGLIVIVDHGTAHHSFLSGFGRIDVEVEQEVAQGEPLGSLPAAKDGKKPELYFEWREKGVAKDPGLDTAKAP